MFFNLSLASLIIKLMSFQSTLVERMLSFLDLEMTSLFCLPCFLVCWLGNTQATLEANGWSNDSSISPLNECIKLSPSSHPMNYHTRKLALAHWMRKKRLLCQATVLGGFVFFHSKYCSKSYWTQQNSLSSNSILKVMSIMHTEYFTFWKAFLLFLASSFLEKGLVVGDSWAQCGSSRLG